MLKKFLEIGQIVSTHGVRGEVRLNPWCDSPDFVKRIKTVYLDENGEKSIAVESARPHGNVVILKLSGINSIDEAQSYRNTVLFMKREDAKLPSNTWFVEDLIGCTVMESGTDRVYGTVTDVQKYPANDVWTVRSKDGRETLIPAIKSLEINVDLESKTVFIKALRGLFDEEESVKENEN